MIPLFIGLSCVNILALAGAAILGYSAAGHLASGEFHMLAGTLAAVACCAVHCIVLTYFIATGKWVREAVEVRHLEINLHAATRSFRARAFPAALGAIGIVFVTVSLGAISDSYHTSPLWHHLLALTAIAANAAAAVIEFQAIQGNGRLIDSILRRMPTASVRN